MLLDTIATTRAVSPRAIGKWFVDCAVLALPCEHTSRNSVLLNLGEGLGERFSVLGTAA